MRIPPVVSILGIATDDASCHQACGYFELPLPRVSKRPSVKFCGRLVSAALHSFDRFWVCWRNCDGVTPVAARNARVKALWS